MFLDVIRICRDMLAGILSLSFVYSAFHIHSVFIISRSNSFIALATFLFEISVSVQLMKEHVCLFLTEQNVCVKKALYKYNTCF
jgi:hypothetical protein